MQNVNLSEGSLLKSGEYRIIKTLGKGGFGITYEAEQVSLGRSVAIKEFFMKEYCNRDEETSHVSVPSEGSRELVERFKGKFLREARMIARLNNPHIVKIYDVFEENGTAYYVMEHLPGGSLKDKVEKNGSFSPKEAEKYIRQLCSALEYLHNQKILHLDIKPSNLLLDNSDNAVLIDFGISKHYDDTGNQTSSTPIGLSKGYAPLEQYQQGDINRFTPATDIYSLGATLYYLVNGVNPPESSVVYDDGLPEMGDNISVNIKNAIIASMQPRRKDRPQSIKEFLAVLDDAVCNNNETEETTVIINTTTASTTSNPTTGTPQKIDTEDIVDTLPKDGRKNKQTASLSKRHFPKWLYLVISGVAGVALFMVFYLRKDDLIGPINVSSISLDKTSVEMVEDSIITLTATILPYEANYSSITWISSDSNIVSVKNDGIIIAIKAGYAVVIAQCEGFEAECNVTVTPKPVIITHEWVDLGLSVKWATCNVGANKPEEYGDYFAWGETTTKDDYSWATYKYCMGTNKTLTKYCDDKDYGYNGYTRKINNLDPSDDVAKELWRNDWRMPTLKEFNELKNNCSWTWININGTKGYKVTSKKSGYTDRSIFLPAAGWYEKGNIKNVDSNGGYWTSSYCYVDEACYFLFNDNHVYGGDKMELYRGQTVRPVCP